MKRIKVNNEITLTLIGEQNAGELFALTDRNREHLRKWLPWVDGTKTVDDTMEFIRMSMEQNQKDEVYKFIIHYINEAAGMIGIQEIIKMNNKCEIGYWLSEDVSGKGIMTLSCKALTDFSFNEIGMNRTTIKCATGNIKSQMIPRRLKFKEEGILRQDSLLNGKYEDNILFAMLKEEWRF